MILITTQCFPPRRGGIENLMEGLADNLGQAGHKVLVLADHAEGDESSVAGAYDVRFFGGWKHWRRWRKAQALRSAIRGGDIEGVFADSWKSAELLSELDVPLAVLAHGMEFPANPSDAKRTRIQKALSVADCIIANSAYTASLVQPYLSGKSRLIVINPPIGPQADAERQALEALEKVTSGRAPVLLTLARLEPRKGVDAVIRALPAVRRHHPDVLYIVAGKGDDRARLEALAAEEGVADCVHFAGAVSDGEKAALFSRADLFVMPARREGDSVEGFGIVYREANWYGVPGLAGREGGAADAVIEGETGLLCNASDQADVTAHLLAMLDDSDGLRRMGKNAAELARGPGQWHMAIEQFLGALR
ncbi:GDP-mannose-dependent alpha-(1-6)-phosphatidylinositol monomannoside mannosyltransferase [Microbulbifer aggregans]|uniref:GDP-mannose-dependent alpha-(1-6)-phosphatidylinositol monomannoside mannosyltransferase n=1 Tax=Microbulbifer aggregans TaxID=1769779 RepID=A0A1C9W425_9GAMM|nr:glycosyltransferase family 4 protein [Microbulbifer aggregans]AOS95918.1 GDP-mannose-dependent alpha-(1-6)-phosphatidylinositol monomannoside mannosyltransferase [Microbulbifer aggregans]